MKKCVIIYNPASGKKKKNMLRDFFEILEKYGYETEVKYTKKKKATDKMPVAQRGANQNRTGDTGVADPCLTAWLWRHVQF